MPHINQTPWDAAIIAKLGTAPYASMAQDGSADAQMADMMNAETVAPLGHVDVPVSTVASYLALKGKLALLEEFAASSTISAAIAAGNQNLANALVAAKELVRILASDYHGTFEMSDPAKYAGIGGLLSYLVTNGDLDASNQADILAMANPPPILWWKSIGSNTPLNEHDLARARTP